MPLQDQPEDCCTRRTKRHAQGKFAVALDDRKGHHGVETQHGHQKLDRWHTRPAIRQEFATTDSACPRTSSSVSNIFERQLMSNPPTARRSCDRHGIGDAVRNATARYVAIRIILRQWQEDDRVGIGILGAVIGVVVNNADDLRAGSCPPRCCGRGHLPSANSDAPWPR